MTIWHRMSREKRLVPSGFISPRTLEKAQAEYHLVVQKTWLSKFDCLSVCTFSGLALPYMAINLKRISSLIFILFDTAVWYCWNAYWWNFWNAIVSNRLLLVFGISAFRIVCSRFWGSRNAPSKGINFSSLGERCVTSQETAAKETILTKAVDSALIF